MVAGSAGKIELEAGSGSSDRRLAPLNPTLEVDLDLLVSERTAASMREGMSAENGSVT
jgi:hypothetical protein